MVAAFISDVWASRTCQTKFPREPHGHVSRPRFVDGVPKKDKEVSQLKRSPMLSLAPPVKLRDLLLGLLKANAKQVGSDPGAIDVLWFSNTIRDFVVHGFVFRHHQNFGD